MTKLDMKTREVELIEERLKQGRHHQKVEELETFKASIGMSGFTFRCQLFVV